MIGSAKSSTSPGVTPPDFALRPGAEADFPFARRLYLSSMQPLLMALDAWNANEIETDFRGYYIPDEVRVVMQNGVDVGWIQVSVTDQELCLDQLHLVEKVRGQGIGTALIRATIEDAAAKSKNVSLSLVKGNRAYWLYQRLGFRQIAEDNIKIHKRFETG